MTLLLAYARERLTPSRILPAVLLVVVATLAGRGWTGSSVLLVDAFLTLALVVSFRIWDDLVDRDRDRIRYPDRVVVRAVSTAPLRAAGAILGFAATVALHFMQGPGSPLLLSAYTVLLATSYARRTPWPVASAKAKLPTGASAVADGYADRIVLLKYGVFTLALIGPSAAWTPRGLLAAGTAFVAASIYEWWHDADSHVFSFGGSR